MLRFRDFVPAELQSRGWFRAPKYQRLEELTTEASAWIERDGIQVVNVETVVLPNFRDEEGSTDPALDTVVRDGFTTIWQWS